MQDGKPCNGTLKEVSTTVLDAAFWSPGVCKTSSQIKPCTVAVDCILSPWTEWDSCRRLRHITSPRVLTARCGTHRGRPKSVADEVTRAVFKLLQQGDKSCDGGQKQRQRQVCVECGHQSSVLIVCVCVSLSAAADLNRLK